MKSACFQLHVEERWPAAMPCLITGLASLCVAHPPSLPFPHSLISNLHCPSGRPGCDVPPTVLIELLLAHHLLQSTSLKRFARRLAEKKKLLESGAMEETVRCAPHPAWSCLPQ